MFGGAGGGLGVVQKAMNLNNAGQMTAAGADNISKGNYREGFLQIGGALMLGTRGLNVCGMGRAVVGVNRVIMGATAVLQTASGLEKLQDGAVWLWDLGRGQEVARLSGHRSFVWSLAFSPDGATLASGSGDTTVRLWDTAPLKTRHEAAAVRPAAERLAESLWRQTPDPAAVAAALNADQTLSESLRQEALRGALRRAQPAEAAPTIRPEP